MYIAIIDYNAGNIRSVDFALRRLGVEARITGNHDEIRKADKVIFPGVGEASTTMDYLRDHGLDQLIRELTQPVLGICLGLQLLCARSEEGNVDCIGIFDEEVRRFDLSLSPEKLKIPHMGWNTLENCKGPVFSTDLNGEYVYFVHSYYAGIGAHTAATSRYLGTFSACLQKGNFFAAQFHPEKSGTVGEKILKNFLKL